MPAVVIPARLVVPVPAALANPMVLPVMVYPDPIPIEIPECVVAAVKILLAV